MTDAFDEETMKGLVRRLTLSTQWRLGGQLCPLREPPGPHCLMLRGAVVSTRYNKKMKRREALVRYHPPDVLKDKWVPENKVKTIKWVEIAKLPAKTKVVLYEQFTASYRKTPFPRSGRRKQSSSAATTAPAATTALASTSTPAPTTAQASTSAPAPTSAPSPIPAPAPTVPAPNPAHVICSASSLFTRNLIMRNHTTSKLSLRTPPSRILPARSSTLHRLNNLPTVVLSKDKGKRSGVAK